MLKNGLMKKSTGLGEAEQKLAFINYELWFD